MTDPMPIAQGGEEAEQLGHALAAQTRLLMMGCAKKVIYLSGGSDTRQGIIEFWQERAAALGVRCKVIGRCMIEIGGIL